MHPLRATQNNYQSQLDSIDRQVASHEAAIVELKKKRTQIAEAKTGIDKLVADLPPEAKPKPPPKPPKK